MSSVMTWSTANPNIVYPRPLEGTQIRLLELQRGSENESLQCRLRVADVTDESLSYEAISYVWGSQDTPARIRCRNDVGDRYVDLAITQHAADALKAVREPHIDRLVWIDSICISQASIQEKSGQVAIMDLIFAGATQVLIWLGSEDPTRPAAAQELFERMAIWRRDASLEHLQATLKPGRHVDWRDVYYTDAELENLLNVFDCEWMWRLWCVQEVALAKRAKVYWSHAHMSWETFSTVAIHIQAKHQGIIARVGLGGVYNVTMLESFRRQLANPSRKPLALSRLLSLTRTHGVTERYDRIFSLSGLDRCLCQISPAEDIIVPDYSRNIEDLYTSIAKKILYREGNLHLLSFVQHQRVIETRTLPSWVPQWHINQHTLVTQFDLLAGHPVLHTLETAWEKSSAPLQLPPGASPTYDGPFHISDDDVLQVDGLLLAVVSTTCSDAVFSSTSDNSWIDTLRHWHQSVVAWYTSESKTDHIHKPPANQVEDVAFRVFYRTILGGHLRYRSVRRDLRAELEAFRTLLTSSNIRDTDHCRTTRAMVTQLCRSRKLFFTTDNQLGLGPQTVQPNDEVCYLSSAAVPLLLRPHFPTRQSWQLLGEVYVNGMASASQDYGPAKDAKYDRKLIEAFCRGKGCPAARARAGRYGRTCLRLPLGQQRQRTTPEAS